MRFFGNKTRLPVSKPCDGQKAQQIVPVYRFSGAFPRRSTQPVADECNVAVY